ncbi:MAG TPA: hypothetical protein VKZ18_02300 [Polyangia bacterium]|nr:hypothetical protein [Polyangia bacterium]
MGDAAVVILGMLVTLTACPRSTTEGASRKETAVKSDGGARGGGDEEIQQLVKKLQKEPENPLHFDVSPSVVRLGELGLPAAAAVLPLLDSDDETTRGRAERVLAEVVDRRLGWLPNRGFLDPFAGQEKMRVIWEGNGSYHFNAPVEKRRKSIALWRGWLEKAQKDGGQ